MDKLKKKAFPNADELYVKSNNASSYLSNSYIAASFQIYFFPVWVFFQAFVIHKAAGKCGLVD